jgi:hypothetical protein
VCQRVLEQSAIAETVPDAHLQLVEFVAKPDHLRADVLPVTVDDATRLFGQFFGDGDADLSQRAHRHRPHRVGLARHAKARNALAVEQRNDNAGLDV